MMLDVLKPEKDKCTMIMEKLEGSSQRESEYKNTKSPASHPKQTPNTAVAQHLRGVTGARDGRSPPTDHPSRPSSMLTFQEYCVSLAAALFVRLFHCLWGTMLSRQNPKSQMSYRKLNHHITSTFPEIRLFLVL